MDPELEAAIRGEPAKKSQPKALTLAPTDALVRTVIGEAPPNASPDEIQAIGAVIANRAKAEGKSVTDVVQEPGQFEAWDRQRDKLLALQPTDPTYQATLATLKPVLDGKDPTGGATYFYHPDAQAALGRGKPSFDDGSGFQVGTGLFFRKPYGKEAEPDPTLEAAIRGEEQPGSVPLGDPRLGTTTAANPSTITKSQEATLTALTKAGTYNQTAPKGSLVNPYFATKDGDTPDEKGAYFIDYHGQLQRTAGGGEDPYVVGKAVVDAARSGDYLKAANIEGDYMARSLEATKSGLASGMLLGGKNTLSAIAGNPGAFVTQGGIDAPIIQKDIAARDLADEGRKLNFPMQFYGGQVGGAVTGGLALSSLTGGAADLPLLAKGAFAAGEGALTGGAQGYLASRGSNAQRLQSAKTGAEIGAVAGPAGEAVHAAGAVVANKLLGLGISPESAQLARAASEKFGINLRAGQISDSPFIRDLDSVLHETPGTGYAKSSAAQKQAFTSAVAKSIGEDAPGLTADVMSRARTRIGNEFERVAAATSVKRVDELQSAIGGVVADAQKVVTDSELKPIMAQVQDIASSIGTAADGSREMSGKTLQALLRKNAPLDRLTSSSDPNVAFYGRQLKNAVLDAVQAEADPADVAALKLARAQWARLKTVEPLAEKAGPEGQISPALLQSRLAATYDNLAYDGGGDLGQLAKIGQRFLKEPANSKTAARARIMALLGGGGLVGAGATGAWIANHPEEAAKDGLLAGLGVGAALLVGKGAAAGLDSDAYRQLLLRSAHDAPAVVGKQPLLNAPYLISPPLAAVVGGKMLNPATQPGP